MEDPQHSQSAAWHRRVGYALVHALLLLAVEWRLLSPAAVARASDWAIVAAAMASSAAFYYLQGSDPGFLTEGLLLRSCNISERDLGDVETGVSVASERLLGEEASICEREYRRERIRQIKSALAKEQEKLAGDSFYDDGGVLDTNDAVAPRVIDTEGMPIAKDEVPSKAGGSMEFCAECALLPPLRAHHCAFCGRCVATFDHHCLLLATCIGEKNRCRFWWFLLLQSVELALAIGVAPASFETPHSSSWTYTSGPFIALMVVLWALFLFAFGLFSFHTFLALANLTTWEFGHGSDALLYLRGFGDCDLPFSRGLCLNLQLFGCFPSFSCAGGEQSTWTPERWVVPDHVDRDSPLVCQHLWENKYYSCC